MVYYQIVNLRAVVDRSQTRGLPYLSSFRNFIEPKTLLGSQAAFEHRRNLSRLEGCEKERFGVSQYMSQE